MITQDKLPELLKSLGFTENKTMWTQKYNCGGSIVVDLDKKPINSKGSSRFANYATFYKKTK